MLKNIKKLKKLNHFKFCQASSPYVQKIFLLWKQDPSKVHPSWNQYFTQRKSLEQKPQQPSSSNSNEQITKKLFELTQHYRNYGHYLAQLDPLNHPVTNPWKLKMKEYKIEHEKYFTEKEMDKQIDIDSDFFPHNHRSKKHISPRELISDLQKMYADKIGFDYQQIQNEEIRNWIQEKVEARISFEYEPAHKRQILYQLQQYQDFIDFFKEKYPNEKVYSAEGTDSFVSGLQHAVRTAATLGIQSVDIGMSHRGRLSVLAMIAKKPLHEIFSEFDQTAHEKLQLLPHLANFEGDISYHHSTQSKVRFTDGSEVEVTIAPNSSHHESVNPVLLGAIRAKIDQRSLSSQQVLPILVHGDASICGQGIVYETQQLEQLDHFKVGGCVHVVINNQIGNTSPQTRTRSSFHPTNISNINRNFCIYVNSGDPELVDWAMNLAIEYRQKWQRDVFVELIGFRRFGHTDLQDPSITHPLTNITISKIPKLYESYFQRLKEQNLVKQEELQKWHKENLEALNKAWKIAQQGDFSFTDEFFFQKQKQFSIDKDSLKMTTEKFKKIGSLIHKLPSNFNFHKVVTKTYDQRLKSIETGTKIEWASAEALALGNLLQNGYNVRFVGEDVERGTFSHRHAVLTDQKTGQKYCALKSLLSPDSKNKFVITNSILSEFGVLGFETGYALNSPHSMVIWEAQFGDFTNGAQVIVDQYIATAEQKWGSSVGIVLLLPHGYDGMGPEHSNARVERFLASVNDDFSLIEQDLENCKKSTFRANMVVCNVTQAANYYHLLIRQFKRDFRKPLVLLTPKRLLRSKLVHSNIEDFLGDKEFQKMIDDDMEVKDSVQKILVCSGKIYFDTVALIQEKKLQKKIAVIRLEQLAPFPYYEFNNIMQKYPRSAEVYFLQEENYNFGPFTFLRPRMNLILRKLGFPELKYTGRKISSQTSTGSSKIHEQEEKQIVEDAVKLEQFINNNNQ